MSIKDTIKEELLNRINDRANKISKFHNEMMEIANQKSSLSYEDGIVEQCEDEYNFLYHLKKFIESI
ncbi:MAG: hypothetical protein J6S67_09770 [Methanobrevibacter sp.]|nr:hypothetical protein [Methanobrevibacter sp.]